MLVSVYPVLKTIHIACAGISLLMFVWRGWASIEGKAISKRWKRRIPDTVDVVLLGTGVLLMLISAQYPWQADWLAIKLLGIVVYIALGMVALRFARSRQVKVIAWLAAIGVFALIIWLAHARSVVF